MRNILTKHGIPDTNLNDASDFLGEADSSVTQAFISEFGINVTGSDAFVAARFAADAIFRGATDAKKVVAYVSKRMTGTPEKAALTVVTMPAGPFVQLPEANLSAVEPFTMGVPAQPVVVKGKRGRKRLGNSDFCKAVSIIEANNGLSYGAMKDCIIAAGIKKSSAAVYLWRYKNGERE